MANVDIPAGEGSERQRLWSLRPELGAAADAFSEVVQDRSILPVREHEAARIRIAHINGCEPCSDTRVVDQEAYGLDEGFYADVDDPAKRGRYTQREQLAIAFAERFALGKAAFDEAFWREMNEAFSAAEILDLAMSVAKWLALGRINAVFDLAVACPIRIRPSSAATAPSVLA